MGNLGTNDKTGVPEEAVLPGERCTRLDGSPDKIQITRYTNLE